MGKFENCTIEVCQGERVLAKKHLKFLVIYRTC